MPYVKKMSNKIQIRKIQIKYKYNYQLPGVKKMVGPINDRLGYRNKTLSAKSVKLMWDICR